jgi:hypothetical protein
VFINPAALANSPLQQVTDRVFCTLTLERVAPAGPAQAVAALADALVQSLAAEAGPGAAAQDSYDSLFGEGDVTLDWLGEPTRRLERTRRDDGEGRVEAAGATAEEPGAVEQSLAEGADSGAGSSGGGD